MKIPSKLKIGGHRVKVGLADLGPDLDGEFDNEKLSIKISERLPDSMRGVSLFHEIFHVLNPQFDLDPIAHMMMESLVEQLYQVLSDNDMLK
jgi:hypothetical protein